MKVSKSPVVFLILLMSHLLMAQQERVPLRSVLKTLETRYAVSFTFLDEVVEGVTVEAPSPDASLSACLQQLSQQTGLTFTQLDDRYIAISKPVIARICGYVLDRESRDKIAGAVVRCGAAVTVTDHNGYFYFERVSETSTVSIQSLGYDSLQVPANKLSVEPCAMIGLTLKTSVLSELVIRNYLTVGIQKKAEGAVTIQTKELGLLPGLTDPDVLFTIQALPGIQSIDETVSNINVRGGTHDQNLVLWDGIKMYQQGHFFGLISAFNPYFTKEVSLTKNGTSAFYGDGVSGTIDIRADDQLTDTLSGGAGFNMVSADVYARIPLSKKTSVHLATRRSLADIVKTPTYQSYYDRAFRGTEIERYTSGDSLETNQKFHFYDISAKLLHDFSSRQKLRVNFLMIHNSIDYQETELVNDAPESKVSSIEQQNLAGNVSYTHRWNNRVRTTAMTYFTHYRLQGINNNILDRQRVMQENEVLDWGMKVDTQVSLGQTDLHTGYQLTEIGVGNLDDVNNPAYYRFNREVLYTHAVFAEWNYTSPQGRTNVRTGARANYFSATDKFRLEPRLALTQKLGDYFLLELLGEMKSQTTTQIIDFQNDFLGVEKRRWVMADGDTVPMIRSQQVSAGIHFHKKDFLVVLEGYYKWVSDIITSSQGFQNQFQYVRSAGSYTTHGLDFLVNRRISRFNFWTSYSYARSRYDFPKLVPPGFSNNLDIRHRVTAGLSYTAEHVELSCGINWHTGRPFTKPVSETSIVDGEIQYQPPNTSRIQPYWRLDVSVKYKFNMSERVRAVAGASVWNVLNYDNVFDAYYQPDRNNQIIRLERKALAFTPNVMFRVSF